jgi:hypothetical protein
LDEVRWEGLAAFWTADKDIGFALIVCNIRCCCIFNRNSRMLSMIHISGSQNLFIDESYEHKGPGLQVATDRESAVSYSSRKGLSVRWPVVLRPSKEEEQSDAIHTREGMGHQPGKRGANKEGMWAWVCGKHRVQMKNVIIIVT